MTSLQNRRKAAIKYLERESAEWKDKAEKELSNEPTREVGRVRVMLIAECLRTLRLLKRRDS